MRAARGRGSSEGHRELGRERQKPAGLDVIRVGESIDDSDLRYEVLELGWARAELVPRPSVDDDLLEVLTLDHLVPTVGPRPFRKRAVARSAIGQHKPLALEDQVRV